MSYKNKLKKWNDSEIYQSEMEFFTKIIDPQGEELILDYGCGTGFMLNYLSDNWLIKAYGYDIKSYQIYTDIINKDDFNFRFDKIYFMHSFAHIFAPGLTLWYLKKQFLKPGGKVYVMTPNAIWLECFNEFVGNKRYKPDPTVYQHFNLGELTQLFEDYDYKIITQGQYGDNISGFCERIFVEAQV